MYSALNRHIGPLLTSISPSARSLAPPAGAGCGRILYSIWLKQRE